MIFLNWVWNKKILIPQDRIQIFKINDQYNDIK